MKTLYFFLSFLLCFFSPLAFALEGKDFTLLSEHTETVPGIESKFIRHKSNWMQNILFATAQATAMDAQGQAGRMVCALGSHFYSATNNTQSSQNYGIKYKLCIQDGTKCPEYNYKIALKPGGSFRDHLTSYTCTAHNNPGQWIITAYTQVTGESYDSATGNAKLTITR